MNGKWGIVLLIALIAAAPAPMAQSQSQSQPRPKLVITEIMYDPTSPESEDKQTEWVEIQNFGDASINLQGLMLTSGTAAEPHAAKQKYVFRDLSLPPHEYLVIGIGAASCYQDYGLPTFGVYCDESHYAWLSNSTDSVAIRDAKKNIIDEVVYSNDSPWPVSRHGASIQFICPNGADPHLANDEGKNWVASGVSNSDEFKGHGRGTPGKPIKSSSSNATAATRPTAARARGGKS